MIASINRGRRSTCSILIILLDSKTCACLWSTLFSYWVSFLSGSLGWAWQNLFKGILFEKQDLRLCLKVEPICCVLGTTLEILQGQSTWTCLELCASVTLPSRMPYSRRDTKQHEPSDKPRKQTQKAALRRKQTDVGKTVGFPGGSAKLQQLCMPTSEALEVSCLEECRYVV